jgi:uncharacterized protein YqfB (UPF0267 family)
MQSPSVSSVSLETLFILSILLNYKTISILINSFSHFSSKDTLETGTE